MPEGMGQLTNLELEILMGSVVGKVVGGGIGDLAGPLNHLIDFKGDWFHNLNLHKQAAREEISRAKSLQEKHKLRRLWLTWDLWWRFFCSR
uniref:Uncharacterized protein n=1 Tax=Nelumbo nucifera TaxID=4432 RepID=A0A822ZN70_NELNU|nr:TPA_asm: hypothetical protein HUJ06_004568 [Nelumbo nucifera]